MGQGLLAASELGLLIAVIIPLIKYLESIPGYFWLSRSELCLGEVVTLTPFSKTVLVSEARLKKGSEARGEGHHFFHLQIPRRYETLLWASREG